MAGDETVIRPEKFRQALAPVEAERLAETGVFEGETLDFYSLPLAGMQPGDIPVGDLSAQERRMYVEYHLAFEAYDELNRQMGSGYMERMAESVRLGKEVEFLQEQERNGLGVDPDKIRTLFRLQRRSEATKHVLFWVLGERLDIHEYVIGVRSGGRIVKGRRKF